MQGGIQLADRFALVEGLAPATPSTSTPDYISLKDVRSLEVIVVVKNGSTVTGSAITLKQATAVAGTSEKALAFTSYFANTDTSATSVMSAATAASNTFTTNTTNSKNLMYRIPVDPATLDLANSFDCLRAGTADAANTVVGVYYLIEGKYAGRATTHPNYIVD